ncbi:acyl carrier protein [Roseiconus lacunae]|uniref:acyl carrier protein n=1 Tax=Roseiconus lacunae TaxID=2605694 RepID=UPI001E2E1E25|nr:phosphopantetheine-binding protein [Roseiconus lacunae]
MALTRKKLTEFLESEGIDLEGEGVTDTTPLFSTNLMDSFKMVALVMKVEESCGVRVGPAQLTLENFDTIESILRFAEKNSG